MARFILKSGFVLIFGIAMGLLLASQVNHFMGIAFLPKELPPEPELVARPVTEEPSPLEPVSAIVLPPGGLQNELYFRAASRLADALAERTSFRPKVLEAPVSLPGRIILVGSGTGPAPADPEGFTITPREEFQALFLESRSPLGHAYGMYYLADLARAGADNASFFAPRTRTPALPYRLVDIGGVGVPQDPARWDPTNYRHNLGAFHDAFLPDPPYVDAEIMGRYESDFRDYVHHIISYGNNGLVLKGFLEFVNFDRVGNGFEVYPPDSPYRARQLAMREHLGRLFCYAHEMGLKVILDTDMVALTPPLREYFERRFGGMATENPEFWEIYRLGLEELFETMPCVDGVMIRIGEAGAIYNIPGWDYTSALEVRSVAAARAMLRAFLRAAEAHNRVIIFRSWSVGIGEVGNMHTDVEAYRELLAGISSPNLLVSTKYVMGDYYSYLPLNPTLFQGEQQRLVEMQNRLEFEGFMAFPDYIAPLHQVALREFLRANPRIQGLWQWNQVGGPQQAGPMSLYPFYGFWLWIDANAWVTSQFAWEPGADPVALTEMWVRRTFGNDPVTVRNMTELLLRSRKAVLKGLYIGPFARQRVLALGLETTPMMWIFEWDIVDGSSSVLSAVYHVSREELEQAIEEGFQAVEEVRRMLALAGEIDPSTWRRPELYLKVVESLKYEENLFETLAWYRRAFLRYYQWLDTGSPSAFRDWQAAWVQFQKEREGHLARYGTNLDFPAFNFFSADAGMAHAVRGPMMMWVARLLLLATALLMLPGAIAWKLPEFPGKVGLQALWAGWTNPARLREIAHFAPLDRFLAGILPAFVLILDHLTLSSFLSPHYLLLITVVMGTFASAFLLLNRRAEGWRIGSTLASSFLLVSAVPLAVAAIRGPLFLWYSFWTSERFRVRLITASVLAGLWATWCFYRTARDVAGRPRFSALGYLIIATGGVLVTAGLVPALMGLEQAITRLNNELAILPLALSLILGIVTHLDIPANLPFIMMIAGTILILTGIFLLAPGELRKKARPANF